MQQCYGWTEGVWNRGRAGPRYRPIAASLPGLDSPSVDVPRQHQRRHELTLCPGRLPLPLLSSSTVSFTRHSGCSVTCRRVLVGWVEVEGSGM